MPKVPIPKPKPPVHDKPAPSDLAYSLGNITAREGVKQMLGEMGATVELGFVSTEALSIDPETHLLGEYASKEVRNWVQTQAPRNPEQENTLTRYQEKEEKYTDKGIKPDSSVVELGPGGFKTRDSTLRHEFFHAGQQELRRLGEWPFNRRSGDLVYGPQEAYFHVGELAVNGEILTRAVDYLSGRDKTDAVTFTARTYTQFGGDEEKVKALFESEEMKKQLKKLAQASKRALGKAPKEEKGFFEGLFKSVKDLL